VPGKFRPAMRDARALWEIFGFGNAKHSRFVFTFYYGFERDAHLFH
jgi:hypothetical protein